MDGAPNMIKNDRSLIAPFTKKKKIGHLLNASLVHLKALRVNNGLMQYENISKAATIVNLINVQGNCDYYSKN